VESEKNSSTADRVQELGKMADKKIAPFSQATSTLLSCSLMASRRIPPTKYKKH